jgi:hypothetical protein
VTFQPSSTSTVAEIHQSGHPDDEARASDEAGWSDAPRELGGTTQSKMGTDS